jgi:hypothetical protein
MDQDSKEQDTSGLADDIRHLVRQVVREYHSADQERQAPAHKAELQEERRRRESLEKRVNELVEENKRSRAFAEEVERQGTIRSELQKQGIAKLDLAFRAIKDDIKRNTDGRLVATSGSGEISLSDYVSQFAQENPEFLPARMVGGSGATAGTKGNTASGSQHFDLDKIRPGMDRAELDKIRDEVARVALQALGGRKS